jgi:AraC-like DNA-binding protein
MANSIADPNLAHTGPEKPGVFSRPVHPALRQAVLQVSGFVDTGAMHVRQRELPMVGIPIILGFGAPYRLSDASDPDLPKHEQTQFLAGLHHTWSTSESTGSGWAIQVNLTPPGAYAVLGVPLRELTNRIVAFTDVCGAPARQLVTDLEQSTGWDERFDLVDRYLLSRLHLGPRLGQSVLWSWQQIERAGGLAPIGGLATELGWSHRHFTSRFREHIGLTPKVVARQVRFANATNLLLGTNQSLAAIAARLEFADQAHFSREFREFSGETPAQFRLFRTALS